MTRLSLHRVISAFVFRWAVVKWRYSLMFDAAIGAQILCGHFMLRKKTQLNRKCMRNRAQKENKMMFPKNNKFICEIFSEIFRIAVFCKAKRIFKETLSKSEWGRSEFFSEPNRPSGYRGHQPMSYMRPCSEWKSSEFSRDLFCWEDASELIGLMPHSGETWRICKKESYRNSDCFVPKWMLCQKRGIATNLGTLIFESKTQLCRPLKQFHKSVSTFCFCLWGELSQYTKPGTSVIL